MLWYYRSNRSYLYQIRPEKLVFPRTGNRHYQSWLFVLSLSDIHKIYSYRLGKYFWFFNVYCDTERLKEAIYIKCHHKKLESSFGRGPDDIISAYFLLFQDFNEIYLYPLGRCSWSITCILWFYRTDRVYLYPVLGE